MAQIEIKFNYLEKECFRNTEMIWLTENLSPDFKTIADFRKTNKSGITNVFKEFLRFCKHVNLLSFSTVACDGTKMRAQNNLNNIFKRKDMEGIEKNIEEKLKLYLQLLDLEDENNEPQVDINSSHETLGSSAEFVG